MPSDPSPRALAERLTSLPAADERRLRRRLADARAVRDQEARRAALSAVAADVDRAEQRLARRQASVPHIEYPPLPVSEHREELLAAIRDNQVVIVAGETGSGKTTQLPKLCLELGRGVRGLIGHTQPRRIAARTVAERIAEELRTDLGDVVGYTVRFTDRVGERTLVKLMTDGILLAEMQRDRMLSRYDTLIIDEAHERSLNIDFLLGYLKQLLPKRPDLKVIVTSATIDTQRFAHHFGDAPIVEVSGRSHPVEVRYRPFAEDDDRDQTQAICDAVEELAGEGPGDVLVFLSGEREIRDTAEAIERMHLANTEVLPLYARLSSADQHRVFQPHAGRRVVLATNVAETSLTVPGIRYVVDPGTARISRYNRRTKVQRLPIEPVSQASANQRAGRCGRVAPGICVRLYDEDDFLARPEFTEPEIQRTNLASVILQMTALGLGDIASFPFVDPPDARNIKDGVALLEELGALDPEAADPSKRLTPVGRRLAQLPLDPRLGRMVLEAERNGCVDEVMVIAAALSIQDPRERPTGKEQEAAELHKRFVDADSDFLSFLKLWRYLDEEREERSSSQFRKLCRNEFLNYLRVREWQDVHGQLRQAVRGLGIETAGSLADEPDADRVHMSLLAGLLSHIGMFDPQRREYQGARNARFVIAPGSAFTRKPPRWVVAAELVETNRMYARVVARIQPEWAERLGAHLVKRSYGEPEWDARRGAARTVERVTLYGLPVVAGRRVDYGRVDRAGAREMFIRHALVEGDWQTHHGFVDDNRALIEDVRVLEARARRRDILVGDDVLFAFFDDRVPDDVTSARRFDQWWKQASRSQPDLLTFTPALLVDPRAGRFSRADFPDEWHQGDIALRLTYVLDPSSPFDGVTVEIPMPLLDAVRATGFDWHVPGHRMELVTELLRSLPKNLRRHFVPAPDYAAAFLDRASPDDGPLLDVLARELTRMTGESVSRSAFDVGRLPAHLTLSFRVVGDGGKVVGSGKDLDAIKAALRPRLRTVLAEVARGIERTGATSWTFGELPRVVDVPWAGHVVPAYPALVDEGDTVGVRVFTTQVEQERAMRAGTRRLLVLSGISPRKALDRLLPSRTKLVLAQAPHGSVAALLDDCAAAAIEDLVERHGGPAWHGDGFDRLREAVRADLVEHAERIVSTVAEILAAANRIEVRVDDLTASVFLPAVTDVLSQLHRLVHPGFVTTTGAARLDDVLRYVRGIERRLESLAKDPARDQVLMRRVQQLEASFDRLLDALPPRRAAQSVEHIQWMLEELRISFFAQGLGTAQPVSEKRIQREIERVAARH